MKGTDIMTKETETQQASETLMDHDPVRRSMLSVMAAGAAMFGLVAAEGASAATRRGARRPARPAAPVFNAYNRTKTFTNNEMDSGTPWVAPQLGNFDLDDPKQNHLAKLKMTNNLVGRRTYIPMMTRLMIAREDLPGGPLLGAASMFTWQLQVPDPKLFPKLPAGSCILRSMYTARYLDPATMEPVEYLKNPYNGKLMKLEDQLFVENFIAFPKGGSLFIEEPQFANDAPDEPKPKLFKKWGDDLILFQGGVYSKPGPHQPRFTENMWVSPHADVMNPDLGLVDMQYSFTGVNKAWEKPWAGYGMQDRDMQQSLAYGRKVHSVDKIPDFHKRVLLEKYPNRI